ncbi:TetR family transcriptional regulator [Frigidibacter mobilis]|uniref:TetR family transcriptional regulator n=2 Tax=Frigidibacter mobilis TaxID=1335048 RepID=A0A165SJT2_9RHOB|nr:TetR family transcriptional regulator [Frigidibacter mobilis]
MRRSKEDAEQTRQAILDAAEELFCSLGVGASTLEKISRRAGVTRGALYWHFKDKGDLLQALHDRSMPVQVVLIETAAKTGHDDPLGLLNTAAIDMLLAFEKDPQQQRMFAIMNSHSPDEEGSAWIAKVNGDLFRTLSTLVKQAHSKGQLSEDFQPKEAAVIMLATVNGLLNEWLRSGKSFPLARLGAKIITRQTEMFRHSPVPVGRRASIR